MQLFMCYTLLQPKIHHFSPKYYYYTLGQIHPEGLAACSFTYSGREEKALCTFLRLFAEWQCVGPWWKKSRLNALPAGSVTTSLGRYSYNFYTLKMIRLYYSRMTFFTMPPRSMRFLIMYPLLRLCVVFLLKRVKLMHIQLCVKSYTFTCVFEHTLTKVKRTNFYWACGWYFWAGVRIY